jgi:hypothetical protein
MTRSKRDFGAARLSTALAALALFALAHPDSVQASNSYTVIPLVQTGTTSLPTQNNVSIPAVATATVIGSGVSINDAGVVAFQASTATGDGIYTVNAPDTSTGSSSTSPIPSLISFPAATNRLYRSFVQINNSGNVVALDRNNNSDFVRIWFPPTPMGQAGDNEIIASANATTSVNQFDLVLTSASIADDGIVLFYGANGHKGFEADACPSYCIGIQNTALPPVPEFLLLPLAGSPVLRPMVGSGGFGVFRDDGATGAPLALLDTTAGVAGQEQLPASAETNPVPQFVNIGQSPGITDDSAAIAFIGDRGHGPGVFLSVLSTCNCSTPTERQQLGAVRVAGEGLSDLGYRLNTSAPFGFSTPITLSAFAATSRVGIIHYKNPATPGSLEGDTFIVSFIGTSSDASASAAKGDRAVVPTVQFTANQGLWTRRIDIVRQRKGNTLEAVLGAVLPVIQVGDPVPGIAGLAVQQIAVNDPLAKLASPDDSYPALAAGAHQLAFWVSAGAASGGATTQLLVYASRGPSLLLNVPGMSQGAATWGSQLYDSSGCTISALGCFETMMSMGHDYFAIRLGNEQLAASSTSNPDSLVASLVTPPRTNQVMVAGNAFLSAGNPNSCTGAPNLAIEKYPVLNAAAPGLLGALPLAFEDPKTRSATTTSLLVPPSTSTAPQTDYLLSSLGSEATPVALQVTTPSSHPHYVMAVGIEGNRIVVADPGCSARRYLDEQPGCGAATAFYSDYAIRGRIVDPVDNSRLIVTVSEGGAVLVTDPNGNTTGISGGQVVINIPGSSYHVDGATDPDTDLPLTPDFATVQIEEPASGSYAVQLTAATGAPFNVDIQVVDSTGTPGAESKVTGTGPAGQSQTYHVSLVAGAGSGTTIQPPGPVLGDVNGDGVVNCADLAIVKASFGKKTGQPGFDTRADVNKDGVVNILDLSTVSRQLPAGTACQ